MSNDPLLSRPVAPNIPPPAEAALSSSTISETLVSVNDPLEPSGRSFPMSRSISPLSPTPTYVGVILTLLGFVLLGITWGQVAGETTVAAQLPYFASGGFIGLGLVMVGLTTISVASRRRDTQLRAQQTQLLTDALEGLQVDRTRR